LHLGQKKLPNNDLFLAVIRLASALWSSLSLRHRLLYQCDSRSEIVNSWNHIVTEQMSLLSINDALKTIKLFRVLSGIQAMLAANLLFLNQKLE